MKRFKVLFGNRRMMVLLTLAILVLAAAALVASSASFTATSANPDNTFTAGALSISNEDINGDSREGLCVLDLTADAMKPGDVVTGTAVIGNSGSLDGAFTLSKSITSNTVGLDGGNLANKLDLVISENGTEVWSGKLGATAGIPVDLRTWAGGESHEYLFTVTFPNDEAASGVDNDFMGAEVTARFQWDAVTLP